VTTEREGLDTRRGRLRDRDRCPTGPHPSLPLSTSALDETEQKPSDVPSCFLEGSRRLHLDRRAPALDEARPLETTERRRLLRQTDAGVCATNSRAHADRPERARFGALRAARFRALSGLARQDGSCQDTCDGVPNLNGSSANVQRVASELTAGGETLGLKATTSGGLLSHAGRICTVGIRAPSAGGSMPSSCALPLAHVGPWRARAVRYSVTREGNGHLVQAELGWRGIRGWKGCSALIGSRG
jgi:hypothetical protein